VDIIAIVTTALKKLAPWCRILVQKLIIAQLVKKLLAFIEPEYLLPCLQNQVIEPYPEPVKPGL
jgi:hypothetical protein